MNQKLYNLICEVSRLENKTVIERTVKLSEEVGELSAEILKLHGLKGTNDTVRELKQHVKKECIDVILVTLSILKKYDTDYEEFEEIYMEKLEKWSKRIKKKKRK